MKETHEKVRNTWGNDKHVRKREDDDKWEMCDNVRNSWESEKTMSNVWGSEKYLGKWETHEKMRK